VSRTPGQSAVRNDVQTPSLSAVPVVELPAPPQQLAARGSDLLGWRGVVLPQMTLLGRKVVMVAELLPEAHAERLCLGCGPVADRVAVSTWGWPEMAGKVPPQAVRIVGAFAVARHWRTALASAVPFARYGHVAMLLPSSVALTRDYLANCLPRVREHGVSVLLADPDGEVTLDVAGRTGIAPEQSSLSRWVHEVVYEKMLAAS
jgi:hypothetical protein